MGNRFYLTTDQLKTLLVDSAKMGGKKTIPRPEYLGWVKKQAENSFIKVLVGFRRVGKSTVLKQFYRYLIDQQNFPESNIFFVNFENDLLLKLTDATDLRTLFDQYKTEVAKPGRIYLFLDELQNVKGWEKFVRTLYETDPQRFNIFITGSNSSLLSSEFSSALSGRSIEKRVHPFSFKEYLDYKDLTPNQNDSFWYQKNKEEVDRHLYNYLTQGALPESVDLDQETNAQYIKSIYTKVLVDDIIKRYRVRNSGLLGDVFKYAVSNVNHPLNMRAIAQEVNAGNITVTVPTIKRYLDMYQKAFALSSVFKFDWKTKRIFNKQNKYYPVDNSLITNFTIGTKEVNAVLLENLVFNKLARKEAKIYYGRDEKGKEIDFVVLQANGECSKYQVCWQLEEGNLKRELGNFDLVGKYLPEGENILITPTGEERMVQEGNTKVKILPLIKFLLE